MPHLGGMTSIHRSPNAFDQAVAAVSPVVDRLSEPEVIGLIERVEHAILGAMEPPAFMSSDAAHRYVSMRFGVELPTHPAKRPPSVKIGNRLLFERIALDRWFADLVMQARAGQDGVYIGHGACRKKP
jgi:hypothetical protein